jgi:uncharacterized protein YbjQ (UPF0145 family)
MFLGFTEVSSTIHKREMGKSRIGVIDLHKSDFIVVTTPTVAGYKIRKVLGMVTGLTPRTRGMGGVFKGAFQALKGGEVKAFTSEIEKARVQATERAIEKAKEMGANAIIGMDIETSDIGQTNITLISATGTAVIIEPE